MSLNSSIKLSLIDLLPSLKLGELKSCNFYSELGLWIYYLALGQMSLNFDIDLSLIDLLPNLRPSELELCNFYS